MSLLNKQKIKIDTKFEIYRDSFIHYFIKAFEDLKFKTFLKVKNR